MNPVDLIAIGLIALALMLGWRSGAVPQVFGLAGALLGVFVAIQIIVAFRASLGALGPVQRTVLSLAVVFAGMAVGETLGSALGSLLRQRLGRGVFETIDRVAGALLGAAQALLMVWLMGGLLATSAMPSLTAVAERSVAIRTLSGFLPPPSTISADLHELLDQSGLPDLFLGLEPAPQPGVPGPGQARADAIARSAEASTVEVEAEACGYTLTGTGFVVAPGYVVTNAHVVAGEHAVDVVLGARFRAATVLFDPQLDVALLYAPDVSAPALRFASSTPARGTQAAALGHPQGGPLTVVPAGVTGSYVAEGRDLYGTGLVTREIVELQAGIQRGDSGGPLILADGTVGGVVFAASRTASDVGYALAPGAVSSRVMPAVGSTAGVGTGACTQ